MAVLQTLNLKPFIYFAKSPNSPSHLSSFFSGENPKNCNFNPFFFFYTRTPSFSSRLSPFCSKNLNSRTPSFPVSAVSNPDKKPTPRRRGRPKKNPSENPAGNIQDYGNKEEGEFPSTIPRKPRRGRRSEAAAVEDFVRKSLEKTFDSIRKQNADVLAGKEVMKERIEDGGGEDDGAVGVVEEEDPDWPADAEIGWGVRASEYFEKYPIRNVVDESGVEIDWEGETDDYWVKEINCLEWESYAFHPSPLVVLVFERYKRAADNWKLLKELEKAIKVYWNAKDRLPPRTVKIDINIERDLAYALKVRECPQLLFLRGNRVMYREKEIRTADELVHMIAYFYYNAKKPSWIDDAALAPPY